MKFKEKYSLEERQTESKKVLSRYTDRIPIIVEKAKESPIANIDKIKFLVPKDLTMGQFSFIIRKRIKLNQDEGLFILINNTMMSTGDIIATIYNNYKDEDGFLYVSYCGENTFG